MKHILRASLRITTPILICLLLVGCSAGSTRPTLQVYGYYIGPEARAFEAALAPFEENTGIEIRYSGALDIEDIAVNLLQSEKMPDILIMPVSAAYWHLVEEGYALPLGDIIGEQALADSYPHLTRVDGQTYGVVFRVRATQSVVWYAPPEFEAADYTVPQSLEELLDLTGEIATENTTPWCVGLVTPGDNNWVGVRLIADIVVRQSGPEVYTGWLRGDIPFSDPRIRQAFEYVEALWLTDNHMYGGVETARSTDIFEAFLPMFDDPPGCYLHYQASFVEYLLPDEVEAGQDASIFYLPPAADSDLRPVIIQGHAAILANDTPEARMLMSYIASTDASQSFAEEADFLTPYCGNFMPTTYNSPTRQTEAEILCQTDTVQLDPLDSRGAIEYRDAFLRGVGRFINGEDLDTVLEEIDASRLPN